MNLIEFLSDSLSSDDNYSITLEDHSGFRETISISKNDFLSAINISPNLNLDHFDQLISDGDPQSIIPHLKGISGNLIAEKYFESLGGEVTSEVLVENGRIDLLVAPSEEMKLNQLTVKNGNILLEEVSINQPFAVEVKNYSTNSFMFDNLDSMSNQVNDSESLTQNNFLGVTEDFLYLDPQKQLELIEQIQLNDGKVILLPYDSETVDVFINNIITNY